MRKRVTDKVDMEKVKGAAQFFVMDESTNTNDEDNNNINLSTSDEILTSVESSSETKIDNKSNVSVNVSTNTSSIPKKARYLETRVQRSYYLDKELVKELDKYAKKNNYDKSDIINWILRKFLEENGIV